MTLPTIEIRQMEKPQIFFDRIIQGSFGYDGAPPPAPPHYDLLAFSSFLALVNSPSVAKHSPSTQDMLEFPWSLMYNFDHRYILLPRHLCCKILLRMYLFCRQQRRKSQSKLYIVIDVKCQMCLTFWEKGAVNNWFAPCSIVFFFFNIHAVSKQFCPYFQTVLSFP